MVLQGHVKVVLFSTIRNLVQNKFAITATSGKSAYNIKVVTGAVPVRIVYRLKRW